MPFNDEETRKEEELFQKHLKIARSLTKEDQENLMKSVEVLTAKAMKLAAKPSLNDEEAALLERIKKMLSEATEHAKALQAILDESLLRQAYAYYHHIKKLAEEGNPEALKIYEDLKPGYQASIKSNLGDN
jgi:hypothetical protein